VVNSTVSGDTSVGVNIFNVTDVLATRRVLSGGAGVAIQFRVTLTMLKTYLQGTTFDVNTAANAAYGKFAAAMYSAIDSGAFLDALQGSGLTTFQSVTVQASSFSAGGFEVYVIDRTPTASPTPGPGEPTIAPTHNSPSEKDVDVGMIVGVTIGGFFLLAFIAAYAYYALRYKRKAVSTVKVVSGGDSFMDLEQIYGDGSTMAPFAGNAPGIKRGSLVHTEVGDAAVLWENDSEASAEQVLPPLTPKEDMGSIINQQFLRSRTSLYNTGSFDMNLTDSIKVGEVRAPVQHTELDIENKGMPSPMRAPLTSPLRNSFKGNAEQSPFMFADEDIRRGADTASAASASQAGELFFNPNLFADPLGAPQSTLIVGSLGLQDFQPTRATPWGDTPGASMAEGTFEPTRVAPWSEDAPQSFLPSMVNTAVPATTSPPVTSGSAGEGSGLAFSPFLAPVRRNPSARLPPLEGAPAIPGAFGGTDTIPGASAPSSSM
jgi:hypothetical protein